MTDRLRDRDRGEIARAFHAGLARGLCDAAAALCRTHGLDTVVASGGVVQNALLLADLALLLEQGGSTSGPTIVVPPNDGGISLGQAALGRARTVHELSIALSLRRPRRSEEAGARAAACARCTSSRRALGRGARSAARAVRDGVRRTRRCGIPAGDRRGPRRRLLPALPGRAAARRRRIVLLPRLRHADAPGRPRPRAGARRPGDRDMSLEPRLVEVRQHILKQNDLVARALRAALPRGRRLRREPGVEPGRRQDGAARARRSRCCGRDSASPRSSATSPPRTTRPAWPAPAPRSGRSPPARSATWRPRWSSARWRAGARRARPAVHRERRQPRLPVVVRPGGGAAARAALGHRGRGQAAEVSRRSSIPPTSRSSPRPTWRRPPDSTGPRRWPTSRPCDLACAPSASRPGPARVCPSSCPCSRRAC